MLFIVTSAQVKELLACGEHIRHVFKEGEVVDEGDHGDESGCPLNRVLVIWVLIEIDHFLGWHYWAEITAEQYAMTINVFTEGLHVAFLEPLFVSKNPLAAHGQQIASLTTRVIRLLVLRRQFQGRVHRD